VDRDPDAFTGKEDPLIPAHRFIESIVQRSTV